MNKILITGGSGFIGSNLALKLLEKGYQVRVLDNLSPQIHGNHPEKTSPLYQSIMDKVEFIKGDITNENDLIKSIQGQHSIIHLAAETGTGQSMYEIKKYCDVNIGGTALLLDILANKKHKIKKILVASSRAIYGEGKYKCKVHGIVYPESRLEINMQRRDFECKCPICGKQVILMPTSEDSKIHPTSVYGITKQNQEQLVLTLGKSMGIQAVAFRYQNVYGPGQSLSNPYTGILSIFSTLIKNGKNINVFEDGHESRDFVYINDVVDATILGLESEESNQHAFNVGADKPIDVLTVANMLKVKYNSSIDIEVNGNYRLGDIRHNYADISKIKQKLGFTTKFSFEAGIDLFTEWVNKVPPFIDKYDKSIDELRIKGLYK